MTANVHEQVTLLSNETATPTAITRTKLGGRYMFRMTSTDYNGATVTLQILGPNEAVWIDLPDGAFTADAAVEVGLAPGTRVRAEITVAVPAAGVYADLARIGD
jgi:hypothetical protein